MKGKSTIKLIISEITALGINVVPLALWLYEDYSTETTMVLYALETVVAVVLAALCVLLLAPAGEYGDDGKNRKKSKVVTEIVLLTVGWMAVLLIFLFFFIYASSESKISASEIKFGMQFIVAFQLFEFFANLLLLRPLSLKDGEILLARNFGGVVLLHLSLIAGIFLAMFVNEWFVLPFAVFKTLVNVAAPILYYMEKFDPMPPALRAEMRRNASRRKF